MLISSRVKIHINIYIYPLVICYIAIEHDTFIVDLAIKDGYFPCFFFLCLPEGNYSCNDHCITINQLSS